MTRLIVHPEGDPDTVSLDTTDVDEIAARLSEVGVEFAQWTASAPLSPDAGTEEVLAAHADDVARLQAKGYTTVDVARLVPDDADPSWQEKAAGARGKFLAEHTHDDDEVRYFVEGSGAFYLRLGGDVLIVRCEAGDLLSVPAGTRHWFDMGTRPRFAAIRFFRDPEGWVGHFTGDEIATRFETYDALAGV
jgi:1,2-dihydroxy-3-keto-5-methylthiopentene dioxygenase